MTPQMQELKTKYILAYLKNKDLENYNKRLFWGLIIIAATCMIGLFTVIQVYETKANLGIAVLNSGICEERDLGYHCETPDKHIFITKE